MAKVDDVVAFVLQRAGTITTFKLHKLLYYAQGWSLVWSGEPLFDAKLKAYENGPCVGQIFNDHRGMRHVAAWPGGKPERLTEDEQDTVLAVLEMYGNKSPEELVEMTHAEPPWRSAWTGDSHHAREISVEAMQEFFEGEKERQDRIPSTAASNAMAARFAEFLRGDS